jgi:hypothetical protein
MQLPFPPCLLEIIFDFVALCPGGCDNQSTDHYCDDCELFSCDNCQLGYCDWCDWARRDMVCCPVCSGRFSTKNAQSICLDCVQTEDDGFAELDEDGRNEYQDFLDDGMRERMNE